MKVLIVEDEPVGAQQLWNFIQSYEGAIEIVEVISSCKALRKWAQRDVEVDLVFCDIELSDGNVLPTLKDMDLNAAVIFTTAYDHFWHEALKLNGIEYLLKPLTPEKVHGAIRKTENIQKILSKDNALVHTLTRLLGQQSSVFYKKRFPVRLNNEVFVLETDSVILFRIVEGLIQAFTGKGKKYPLVEETLNELETKLNPEYFFRINRSEIINAKYIESIRVQSADGYVILMKGMEEKVTVSSSRVAQFRDWLDDPLRKPRKKS